MRLRFLERKIMRPRFPLMSFGVNIECNSAKFKNHYIFYLFCGYGTSKMMRLLPAPPCKIRNRGLKIENSNEKMFIFKKFSIYVKGPNTQLCGEYTQCQYTNFYSFTICCRLGAYSGVGFQAVLCTLENFTV
jgi:hypothetical protein